MPDIVSVAPLDEASANSAIIESSVVNAPFVDAPEIDASEAPVVLDNAASQYEISAIVEVQYRPYEQSSLFQMVELALPRLEAITRKYRKRDDKNVYEAVENFINIFKACRAISESFNKRMGQFPVGIMLYWGPWIKGYLKNVNTQLQYLAQNPNTSEIYKDFFSLLSDVFNLAPTEPNDFHGKLFPFINIDYLKNAITKLKHAKIKTLEDLQCIYQVRLVQYKLLVEACIRTVNPHPLQNPVQVAIEEEVPQEDPEADSSVETRLEIFRKLQFDNEALLENTVLECSALSAIQDTLEIQIQESFDKQKELSTEVLDTLPVLCQLANVVLTPEELSELMALKTAEKLPDAASDPLVSKLFKRVKSRSFLDDVYTLVSSNKEITAQQFFAEFKALDPRDAQLKANNYGRLVFHLFNGEGLQKTKEKLMNLESWLMVAPTDQQIKDAKRLILTRLCTKHPILAHFNKIDSAISLHQAESIELVKSNRHYADIEEILAAKKTTIKTATDSRAAYSAIIETLEAARQLEQERNFLNINLVKALIEKLNILTAIQDRSPENVKKAQKKCEAVLLTCLNKAVNHFDLMLPKIMCDQNDYVQPVRLYLNDVDLKNWIERQTTPAQNFKILKSSWEGLLQKITPTPGSNSANIASPQPEQEKTSTCHRFILNAMAQPAHTKIAIVLLIAGGLALVTGGLGIGLIAGAGISFGVSLLAAGLVTGGGALSMSGGAFSFFWPKVKRAIAPVESGQEAAPALDSVTG